MYDYSAETAAYSWKVMTSSCSGIFGTDNTFGILITSDVSVYRLVAASISESDTPGLDPFWYLHMHLPGPLHAIGKQGLRLADIPT